MRDSEAFQDAMFTSPTENSPQQINKKFAILCLLQTVSAVSYFVNNLIFLRYTQNSILPLQIRNFSTLFNAPTSRPCTLPTRSCSTYSRYIRPKLPTGSATLVSYHILAVFMLISLILVLVGNRGSERSSRELKYS